MGALVDAKILAIQTEIAAITARLLTSSGFVEDVEFGTARKRVAFSDSRRARDEKRLHYLETQLSQLSTSNASRSLVVRGPAV